MKKLTILSILFISLAFVAPMQASAATSAGVKPDSFFYTFDLLGEKISLFLTRDPYEKAKKDILFADERITEIKASGDNQKAALKATNEFTKNISLSFESFDKIKEDDKKVGFLVSFENRYKEHWGALSSLYDNLPQEEQPVFRENLVVYASKLQRGLDEVQSIVDKKSKTVTTTSVSNDANVSSPNKEIEQTKINTKPLNTKKPKKGALEPNKKMVSSVATSPIKIVIDTNEQIAVKMATDIEYANSPLDKTVRQEIKSNWDSIMKYYTGEKGGNTVENMYNDILDAYNKWKNWQQYELEMAKCNAELNEEFILGLAEMKKNLNGEVDSSYDSILRDLNRASGSGPDSCRRAASLSRFNSSGLQSYPTPDTYTPNNSYGNILDSFEKQKQESRLKELEMNQFLFEQKQKRIENSRSLNCTMENGYYSDGVCNHF